MHLHQVPIIAHQAHVRLLAAPGEIRQAELHRLVEVGGSIDRHQYFVRARHTQVVREREGSRAVQGHFKDFGKTTRQSTNLSENHQQ